jgi:hypothetical protein
MRVPWQLRSYAEYCIRPDWTHEVKGDREWAESLASTIDKFAKNWVADNCPGRVRAKEKGK